MGSVGRWVGAWVGGADEMYDECLCLVVVVGVGGCVSVWERGRGWGGGGRGEGWMVGVCVGEEGGGGKHLPAIMQEVGLEGAVCWLAMALRLDHDKKKHFSDLFFDGLAFGSSARWEGQLWVGFWPVALWAPRAGSGSRKRQLYQGTGCSTAQTVGPRLHSQDGTLQLTSTTLIDNLGHLPTL